MGFGQCSCVRSVHCRIGSLEKMVEKEVIFLKLRKLVEVPLGTGTGATVSF